MKGGKENKEKGGSKGKQGTNEREKGPQTKGKDNQRDTKPEC